MKVVRCSDDAYAQLAEFAASNRLNLAQSVDRAVECLVRDVDESPDMEAVVNDLREVIREELHATLGDSSEAKKWSSSMFDLALHTNSDVRAICDKVGIKWSRLFRES